MKGKGHGGLGGGISLFNWAAKRWGKKPVFLAGTAASALVLLSLLLVGRIGIEPFLATQIAMGLFDFATSGFLMLPNALLADVVDYDAARTGRRREAIHFGVQAFFQKLAIGASIVVSSALMYSGVLARGPEEAPWELEGLEGEQGSRLGGPREPRREIEEEGRKEEGDEDDRGHEHRALLCGKVLR